MVANRRDDESKDQSRDGPQRDWSNSRYVGGGGAASHRSPGGMPPPASPRPQATPPGPRSPSGWDSRQEIASYVRDLLQVDPRVGTGTRNNAEGLLLSSTSDISAVDSSKFFTSSSNTNVKINNCFIWEETGAGRPKQGTETGSGVAAWAWFKRTNIPIRDAAVNMKGSLGLLAANAISHNMQICGTYENELRPNSLKDTKEGIKCRPNPRNTKTRTIHQYCLTRATTVNFNKNF
jgi:hypothetical protein